ncbi:MAG: serine--tRNA ligase [Nitrospinaceae bacterium]|jgi:seryl-tRNA synthetase|nr:serine--tRNA ligase [Nitrospinaceae bacterium]MDP7610997.1 serine--tRNA ligase [Nitrospinaceae bacterium]
MLDQNLLINDHEETKRRLGRKGVPAEQVEELRDVIQRRKALVGEVDGLRAEINEKSKQVGELFQRGEKEEANELKKAVPGLKKELEVKEGEFKEVDDRRMYLLLRVPNLPEDNCPDGFSDDSNVTLRMEGYNESDYEGKEFKPHWEIGEELGILDAERATKLSGSMFALLRGDGARLHRALIQFALELNKERNEEILPPHFVRPDMMQGTGTLPKFEEDAYRFRDDDLWAIPTGEVPLTNLHSGEILSIQELPKRYMAYTVCFRREAGSAGKDTRGMQRLHEFHKVELVRLCAPEQVQDEFELLVRDAERPLKQLGLPYRVLDLCGGDITFSSARVHDLEVYSPGTKSWLEVSSVGIFTDFQTRRGNSRFRRSEKDKPELLHSLNGSGLAAPRVWAAVVEHGYQPDGSIRIPEPLVPFMGGQTEIRRS